MPRPETLDDVVALVRQSKLVDEVRLSTFLDQLRVSGFENHTPRNILSLMAAQGLVTCYQASELAVGRRTDFHLGPYRILDRLGRGGMGQVYLCEHTVVGRQVAVKVLSSGLQSDAGARKRFAREAKAAAVLDHPNVVLVYDIEVGTNPPYMVMEYVDGMSWQAAVVRQGPFSPAEVANCGMQAARGLQAIADAGLIHRDIKPANLLVDRTGVVKILDLGIVRMDGEATLTLDGGTRTILGTLDYLAPEQAVDSSGVDIRADLYALGSTLYFLLAGHPPFPDGDVDEKVQRKLTTDPPPLDRVRGDVPPELTAVIHRLLARDSKKRYETPAEAADALQAWAEPSTNFPSRLFANMGPPTFEDYYLPSERNREGDSAPPTLRVVRSGLATVFPRTSSGSKHEDSAGGVDFDSPPTKPVKMTDSDLYHAEPTGRMTPYSPAYPSTKQLHRGHLAVAISGLVLLISAAAWFVTRLMMP